MSDYERCTVCNFAGKKSVIEPPLKINDYSCSFCGGSGWVQKDKPRSGSPRDLETPDWVKRMKRSQEAIRRKKAEWNAEKYHRQQWLAANRARRELKGAPRTPVAPFVLAIMSAFGITGYYYGLADRNPLTPPPGDLPPLEGYLVVTLLISIPFLLIATITALVIKARRDSQLARDRG